MHTYIALLPVGRLTSTHTHTHNLLVNNAHKTKCIIAMAAIRGLSREIPD